MRRRTFTLGLSALAGAMAVPASAQRARRTYRVGALLGGGQETMHQYRNALSEQLATHGFVEGANLDLDARGSTTVFHEDRGVAREFISAKCDAILVCGTRPTQAVQAATKTVPIVFTWVSDPIASGLVKTYATPGANVTGVSNRFAELAVKRVELARELLPKAKRIAVLVYYGDTLYRQGFAERLRKAAVQLQFEIMEMEGLQWASLVEEAVQRGAEAILPTDDFVGNRLTGDSVLQAVNRLRIPAIFANRASAEAGGLVSLGTNPEYDIRRGADLLARVLKGASPATLPVDQATRFELVLNLKTAREIGVAVPQSVSLRADRLIE